MATARVDWRGEWGAFKFRLARDLGMTVRRLLLAECDSAELTQWIAWYRVKAEADGHGQG